MFLKYFLLALVIYGIYRFTSAPKIGNIPDEPDVNEDEYTDYEEVD